MSSIPNKMTGLLALALTLAGCGGDSPTEPDRTTRTFTGNLTFSLSVTHP